MYGHTERLKQDVECAIRSKKSAFLCVDLRPSFAPCLCVSVANFFGCGSAALCYTTSYVYTATN